MDVLRHLWHFIFHFFLYIGILDYFFWLRLFLNLRWLLQYLLFTSWIQVSFISIGFLECILKVIFIVILVAVYFLLNLVDRDREDNGAILGSLTSSPSIVILVLIRLGDNIMSRVVRIVLVHWLDLPVLERSVRLGFVHRLVYCLIDRT